jgi:tetratricopeptide (TPR) repeat protein
MTQIVNTGKELETSVAHAYRQMGAWKVEHDVELAGNQIDVYAELMTPGQLLHRIAVEVKDWKSPVGIDVINKFGHIVELLRGERLIDEGIIISSSGFSRPARKAAQAYGVRLLEMADLDAMAVQAEPEGQTRPTAPPAGAHQGPYFAHPYPLQENFTGRVPERQMLSEWFVEDERSFLALTAMGGMGKSALAWVWLHRDLMGLPLPGLPPDPSEVVESCSLPEDMRPDGVLWWSFYDVEATFAAFLDKALNYASGGGLDPAAIPSAYDRVRRLVALLEERRFLIFLDGFERELRAYASLSAVYQGDHVIEDTQGDYRACTDLHAANFLRWTSALAMPSRVLLTSRLLPKELDELAGCRREELTALDPEDALSFFHVQGVKGTRAEIQAVCEPCGYHPLTLRLLAGMIAKDPVRPGDVAAVDYYDLIDDVVPQERQVLALAYDALSPSLQELLSRLAASRTPVEYEVAAMLSPFEGRRKLGLAFGELADRGLIFFDKKHWRYDLHPIVRAYAYDRLAEKESIHSQMRVFYLSALAQDVQQVNSVDDLAPIMELYHHTARAGLYDEAVKLFHDWLADPLYYRFGAYRTEINLLRALFPEAGSPATSHSTAEDVTPGGEGLPHLQDPSAQAWTLNALASSYTCSGQPRSAVPLLKLHHALQEELGDMASLAIGLGNLASVQLELGELEEAEQNLRRSIEWGEELGQLGLEASGRTDLGRLLAYRGAFDEAGRELDTAITIQQKIGHVQSEVLSWIYRAHLTLLMGDPQAARDAAYAALQLAEETAASSQFVYPVRSSVWAHWLLGSAQCRLTHEVDAESHLGEALTLCRQINLVELEPDILLAWASWHYANADSEQARRYALEALSIADRSQYRLKQAELHNFLARWELDMGDVGKAREHAEIAKERAWCDGPPYYYKPALDQAQGLLELMNSPNVRR